MTDLQEQLSSKIAELFKAPEVTVPFDGNSRMNVDMIIYEMSETQVADLMAMINYLERELPPNPMYVLAQAMHDIRGIGDEIAHGPQCFCPRSSGYAAKEVPSEN